MKDFASYLKEFDEIGYVQEITHSLVYVSGLPGVHGEELVSFESGELGQVISLTEEQAEIIFFSNTPPRVGTRVSRTGTILSLPDGNKLLGKTINPLCQIIGSKESFNLPNNNRSIYGKPSGIVSRKRISKFFETGVTIVDMLLPLGFGQRELVIGDRKTGKSDFLLKAISMQAKRGVICIYVSIGKKMLDIKKIEEFFTTKGISQNVILIASSSNDPSSLIYLAPFSGMTLAESFRDMGENVLLVLDDLSTHAKVYREISLLGKRFPGRNSYPGDMFYLHSRLLERAGNFITDKGGEAAITCLPIAETTQGDMVGYIQTNLMSITDGHIYFDTDLFAKGRRPAVNPFLSVTRVGRQTQPQLKRDISRELISFLTLYEKMQGYIHFGAEVTDSVLHTLTTGDRIISFMNQNVSKTIEPNLQIFLFTLLWTGAWQSKSPEAMRVDMSKIEKFYESDKAIKGHIDELITKVTSFNELLGTIGKNMQQYLKLLEAKN